MAAEDSGKTQWHELYHEVVETNLCTGCAACVMACPRDVLEYDHSQTYHPFNVELSTAADDCSHGQRGRPGGPGAWPGRRAGLGAADLGPGDRADRGCADLAPVADQAMGLRAVPRDHAGRRPGGGRLALHLRGQPTGHEGGGGTRPQAAGAGGDELPGV